MGKKQTGSYTLEEIDTFSLLAHDVAATVRSGELREEIEQSYIDAYTQLSQLWKKETPIPKAIQKGLLNIQQP